MIIKLQTANAAALLLLALSRRNAVMEETA
jgi:hypothetical protein